MKRSVLIGLLGAALANSALAALLPVGVPPGLLSHRHSDDGEGLAVDTAATSTQPSVDTHVEAHEQGHGANSSTVAGSFDPSKLYGPEGEVMEPVPGINAPPSYHHHHGAMEPSRVLNETAILAGHNLNPLSYWTHDFVFKSDDERLGGDGQHGRWIVFGHGLVMVVTLLFVLPLALAFRTARSSLYGPTVLLVGILSSTSLIAAWVYRARTSDLYAHETHSSTGYVALSLVYGLGAWDLARFLRPGCCGATEGWAISARATLCGRRSAEAADARHISGYSAVDDGEPKDRAPEHGLAIFRIADDDEDDECASPASNTRPQLSSVERSTPLAVEPGRQLSAFLAAGASQTSSTSTLHHQHHHHDRSELVPPTLAGLAPAEPTLSYARQQAETLIGRLAVVLGFACTLSGIAIYAGACRAQYLNGCLAHLIKGGIFFGYGVLTWARYLGAWQEYGWAWNVRPRPRLTAADGRKALSNSQWTVPTAEMVESAVICIYGMTNTWLERLGAKTGAPLTIHEVQHISIALMFWFGGLLGILLEVSAARRILSAAVLRRDGRPLADVRKPPSWTGSFNPFPALVIGVTGLAMSAHHQAYVLAIEVHALWGNLLAIFAVLRVATYVFLWLRPPRSILPSRPPTEALAAFSLCAGGVVFILSTEQVVYGAMRSGWDSIMAFLTGTVSLVSIVFAWSFVVFFAKGWATEYRLSKRSTPGADSGQAGSFDDLESSAESTLSD